MSLVDRLMAQRFDHLFITEKEKSFDFNDKKIIYSGKVPYSYNFGEDLPE